MGRFAEVAALFGYWPATTDEAHRRRRGEATPCQDDNRPWSCEPCQALDPRLAWYDFLPKRGATLGCDGGSRHRPRSVPVSRPWARPDSTKEEHLHLSFTRVSQLSANSPLKRL